jgi:hypothetical protein
MEGYLGLFDAVVPGSIEERNMHQLLDAVVNQFYDGKSILIADDIIQLYDRAIDHFDRYQTIQHKKGEFLIKADRLPEALETFKALYADNERDEYSLHGVAKTNYWIAKRIPDGMERQAYLNQARLKFEEGMGRRNGRNHYFYTTYLDMTLWQWTQEEDDAVRTDLEELARGIVNRAKKAGVDANEVADMETELNKVLSPSGPALCPNDNS